MKLILKLFIFILLTVILLNLTSCDNGAVTVRRFSHPYDLGNGHCVGVILQDDIDSTSFHKGDTVYILKLK